VTILRAAEASMNLIHVVTATMLVTFITRLLAAIIMESRFPNLLLISRVVPLHAPELTTPLGLSCYAISYNNLSSGGPA